MQKKNRLSKSCIWVNFILDPDKIFPLILSLIYLNITTFNPHYIKPVHTHFCTNATHISPTLHGFLDGFRWLAKDLMSQPTRIAEIIPDCHPATNSAQLPTVRVMQWHLAWVVCILSLRIQRKSPSCGGNVFKIEFVKNCVRLPFQKAPSPTVISNYPDPLHTTIYRPRPPTSVRRPLTIPTITSLYSFDKENELLLPLVWNPFFSISKTFTNGSFVMLRSVIISLALLTPWLTFFTTLGSN